MCLDPFHGESMWDVSHAVKTHPTGILSGAVESVAVMRDDRTDLQKNLDMLLQVHDKNPRRVSDDAGLNATAVRDIQKGKSKKPSYATLHAIAQQFGCTADDLWGPHAKLKRKLAEIAEDRANVVQFTPEPHNEDSGHTSDFRMTLPDGTVVEIEVKGGMGLGGFAPPDADVEGHGEVSRDHVRDYWALPPSYLRRELNVEPGAARIIEVRGDSMVPTLHGGDRVMVDTADTNPTPPGVFAISDGFGVAVKRLERIPNSDPPAVRVISDNERHSSHSATPDEIRIIGRCVWRAHRL